MKRVRIVEVGPRDGLQNRAPVVATALRVRYVDALTAAGLPEIEVGAFVRPDRVPQMADTARVFEAIRRGPGTVYSALVPNEYGLERALEARADKVAVFTAASETFNKKNINVSIEESFARFAPVLRKAQAARLPARGYISTAFWCPYEGKVAPERVIDVCRRLADLGVGELSIGDTIGKASADDVRALLGPLLRAVPPASVFLHLHDTFGKAVENALCAFQEFDVTGFDSSAGGIGGCPFAPGAPGNASTESLLRAFQKAGAGVPCDPGAVARAAQALAS